MVKLRTLIDKIQFHIFSAALTTLDKNWDTLRFVPTFRYIHYSRLYMPCSGKGYLVCNKRTYTLQKGFMYLISPYAHIRASCPKRLVKYWCHFNAVVKGLDNDIFFNLPGVTELKLTKEQFDFNSKLFDHLVSVPKNSIYELTPSPLEELRANSLLALLVEPFLKMASQEIILHGDMNRIMKLVQYMNENLASEITLKSLAKMAGLHPNYLCEIFLRYIGLSPIAFLLNLRLTYAMVELQRGKMRIGEIAERIGIRSSSSFSQFFRQRTGSSPREWRKMYDQ